jgi:hypothetical protein
LMVILAVSISHPRKCCWAEKLASPLSIFDNEIMA